MRTGFRYNEAYLNPAWKLTCGRRKKKDLWWRSVQLGTEKLRTNRSGCSTIQKNKFKTIFSAIECESFVKWTCPQKGCCNFAKFNSRNFNTVCSYLTNIFAGCCISEVPVPAGCFGWPSFHCSGASRAVLLSFFSLFTAVYACGFWFRFAIRLFAAEFSSSCQQPKLRRPCSARSFIRSVVN